MLTPADKDALHRMPDGWFRPRDLPFMVRSPDYRCKRLEASGVLVSRISGKFPDVWREYAKTPNVEFSGDAPIFGAASAGTQG